MGTRFRYCSRIQSLSRCRSSRSAQSACSALPRQLRGTGRSRRTVCMVMVDAPARASAPGVVPRRPQPPPAVHPPVREEAVVLRREEGLDQLRVHLVQRGHPAGGLPSAWRVVRSGSPWRSTSVRLGTGEGAAIPGGSGRSDEDGEPRPASRGGRNRATTATRRPRRLRTTGPLIVPLPRTVKRPAAAPPVHARVVHLLGVGGRVEEGPRRGGAGQVGGAVGARARAPVAE
jgi:hypothetical protein